METVLATGGELEQAAVATGFMELLLHHMDTDAAAKTSLLPFFGPEARRFCRQYNQFGGIHWPELEESS